MKQTKRVRLKTILLGVAEVLLFGSIIVMTIYHWNHITQSRDVSSYIEHNHVN